MPDHGAELRRSLLTGARGSYVSGDVAGAWLLCEELAALCRSAGDTLTLADAALVIRGTPLAPVISLVHGLCAEALAALGDRDPERSRKLHAQLVATGSPWDRPSPEIDSVDHDATFLALQARHTELLHA